MRTKQEQNKYFIEYRKNNLAQLSVTIPKNQARILKEKLELDGLTYSQFARMCIYKYLNDKKD